jgi:hypothetical protein
MAIYQHHPSPRSRQNDQCRDEFGLLYAELQTLLALAVLVHATPELPPVATPACIAALVRRVDDGSNAAHHLRALERLGLAERLSQYGAPHFWKATSRGLAAVGVRVAAPGADAVELERMTA